MADFINSVIEANNGNIENVSLIQGMIDDLFQDSVVIAKIQFNFYLAFFYLPYILMNIQEYEFLSIYCWFSCLLTQILFVGYELVQM